jgi:Immunity protein 53
MLLVSAPVDHLHWLQEWVGRAFGDGPVTTANPWVQIETNDPGWTVTISLTDTAMQTIDFDEIEVRRSEIDWIRSWIDGGTATHDLEWQGRGGSENLYELLTVFRSWVEKHGAS